jgi:putative oxidoreductase
MQEAIVIGAPSTRTQAWGLMVLRVAVGIVFFMHGWQKLFMMGLPGVTGFFGMLGIPAPAVAATVVSFLELVGGAALIAGLLTRWVAIPLAIEMLVATLLVHLPNGFFAMDDGYELVFLLLAGAVTLALAGPGALAVDNRVVRGLRGTVLADR